MVQVSAQSDIVLVDNATNTSHYPGKPPNVKIQKGL